MIKIINILYKENIYYLMGKYKNVLKEYSNSAIDESCRFFFYICTVKSLCALFEYDFDGALDNIKLVYKYDIINNSIDYKDIENKIIKIKEDFFNDFLTAEELKNNIKKIKEMLEPVIFRRLNNYIWNKIFKKENIKNSSYIAEINKEIQELNEKLKILAEIKREVINNRKNFIFFIESRINLEKYILNINQELIKSNSDKFLELYSNKNLKVFYTALRLLFGDMIVTANYIKDKTSSIEKANAIDLMNNFSITFKILNIMKTFNTISQERGKKIVPIEIAYKVSNICNNPFKDYTVIELVAREFTLDKKSEIVKLNDESDIISRAILMGGKILSSFPLKTSNNLHACMLENRYDISIDNKLISAFKNNFEVIKRQLYITNLYFNQIKFNTMPLPPLPLPALPLLPPLPALPVLISRQQRSNTTSKPLPMLPSVSFQKVNNNRTINIKTRLST